MEEDTEAIKILKVEEICIKEDETLDNECIVSVDSSSTDSCSNLSSIYKTEHLDIEDGFQGVSTAAVPDSTVEDFLPQDTASNPVTVSSTIKHVDYSSDIDLDPVVLDDEPFHEVKDENEDIQDSVSDDEVEFNYLINIDVPASEEHVINDNYEVVNVKSEDEIHTDNDQDDLFGNRIILGSKPTYWDSHSIYNDDKCFNSLVCLENCKPYLHNSRSYCTDCRILFKTVKALDLHINESHSEIVAISNDEKNNIDRIPNNIANNLHNTPKNLVQKFLDEDHDNDDDFEFNQPLSNIATKKINYRNINKETEHSASNQYAIATGSETTNSLDNETRKENKKLERKAYLEKFTHIKRNTKGIFKMIYCKKCEAFRKFVSKSVAHAKGNCKHSHRRLCDTCGLMVSHVDTNHYEDHDNYPSLGIKTTLFFDRKLNSITPPLPRLFICNKCHVGFEKNIYKLYHKCGKEVAHMCEICDIEVVESYYQFHVDYHEYDVKNIVKLDTLSVDPKTTEIDNVCENNKDDSVATDKNKIITNVTPDSESKDVEIVNAADDSKTKRLKKTASGHNNKLIFFQCSKCKVSSSLNSFRETHTTCTEKVYNCNKCKLKFVINNRHRHLHLHEKHHGLNRGHYYIEKFEYTPKERVFSTIKVKKLKEQGYVVLYQCSVCNLVSTKRSIDFRHTLCKKADKSYQCNICGFDCFSWDLADHVRMHEDRPDMKSSDIIISLFQPLLQKSDSVKEIKPKIVTEVKPKAKPKLYQCSKCKMTSSGVHFQFTHKTDFCFPKSFYLCPICNIKLYSRFKLSHEKIHEQKPNVNLKYFDVVLFEPNHLSKPITYSTWVHHAHRGKLVLFQCTQCELVSTDRLIVAVHDTKNCENPDGFYYCKICGYKCFISHKVEHRRMHKEWENLTDKDVRISKFDPIKASVEDTANKSKEEFIIFRCEICDTCCDDNKHECKEGLRKLVCDVCSLAFDEFSYKNHALKHGDPKYTRNVKVLDIEGEIPIHIGKHKLTTSGGKIIAKVQKISEINSNTNGENVSNNNDIVNIYRCPCGLHFLTVHSVCNHQRRCNLEPTNLRNICQFCNLIFFPSIFKEHLSKHHDNTEEEFKYHVNLYCHESKRPKLYKCRDCKVHFATMSDFKGEVHYESCGIASGVNCHICGLAISVSNINDHRKLHANDKFPRADDFDIATYSKLLAASNMANDEHLLFRCTDCDFHFVNMDELQCHFPCGSNARRLSRCSWCNLKFYSTSISSHVALHHNNDDYEMKEVFIKNIDPNVDLIGFVNESNETINDRIEVQNKLYRCGNCQICFVDCNIFDHHNCDIVSETSNFICDVCNITFNSEERDKHLLAHHCEESNLTNEKDYTIHVRYPANTTLGNSIDESKRIKRKREHKSNVKIYKCFKCDVCYTSRSCFVKHFRKGNEHTPVANKKFCFSCRLNFGPMSYRKHRQVHHIDNDFKLKDFKIISIQDLRSGRVDSESDSSDDDSEDENTITSSMKICDDSPYDSSIVDATVSSSNLIDLSEIEITTLIMDVDQSVTVNQSIPETKERSDEMLPSELSDRSLNSGSSSSLNEKGKVKFYRCKECNVNFLKQDHCYRHALVHVPMSNFDSLECKICTLNFPLQYLKTHMNQHRNNTFGLEDILIEEYEPVNTKKSVPKIDIYNAIDRMNN